MWPDCIICGPRAAAAAAVRAHRRWPHCEPNVGVAVRVSLPTMRGTPNPACHECAGRHAHASTKKTSHTLGCVEHSARTHRRGTRAHLISASAARRDPWRLCRLQRGAHKPAHANGAHEALRARIARAQAPLMLREALPQPLFTAHKWSAAVREHALHFSNGHRADRNCLCAQHGRASLASMRAASTGS